MKKIFLFLNYQKIQIACLLGFVLIPYALVSIYLPSIPYMHYFFILALFLTKILVFSDQQLKINIKSKIQSQLARELKQNPSRDQIYSRIQFMIMARNVSLLMSGTAIIIMAIIFKQF